MYAAPEVLEGKTPTTLADIYALGVMLYQIVVGRSQQSARAGMGTGCRRRAPEGGHRALRRGTAGEAARECAASRGTAAEPEATTGRKGECPTEARRNRRIWMASSIVAVHGVRARRCSIWARGSRNGPCPDSTGSRSSVTPLPTRGSPLTGAPSSTTDGEAIQTRSSRFASTRSNRVRSACTPTSPRLLRGRWP